MSEPISKNTSTRISRRRFLALLATGGVALAAGTGRMFFNIYRPQLSRYRLPLSGLRQPLRLLQLSDLHFGPYLQEGSVRNWVEMTLAQTPDLIVITGDIVDHGLRRPLAPLLGALAELKAPLGVWAVWGNHDRNRFRRIEVLEQALQEIDISILNNRGLSLRPDFYLAGVDDLRTGHPNLSVAFDKLPQGAASVLLSHNPDLLPQVPGWVGLTLCGHTHGGQVKLPLIGAPVTSSRYGQRFVEGWVDAPGSAYVSRGLGVSMLPLRLNSPPELVILDLLPENYG